MEMISWRFVPNNAILLHDLLNFLKSIALYISVRHQPSIQTSVLYPKNSFPEKKTKKKQVFLPLHIIKERLAGTKSFSHLFLKLAIQHPCK